MFSKYLLLQDARLTIQKTWIQFKIDFRQAVRDLCQTGNLQARSLHDNVLCANLMQDVIEVIQESFAPLLEAAQAPQDPLPAPAPECHPVSLRYVW